MATLVSNRFIWMYENMYVPKRRNSPAVYFNG